MDEKRIVTIHGVRGAGKSSKMEEVVNVLFEQGVSRENFLWVDFNDERLVNMASNELDLIIEAYLEMYPDIDMSGVYMFFYENTAYKKVGNIS